MLVIEVVGAANIKKLYPESTLIFHHAAQLDAGARLRGRGTESEEAIAGRLKRGGGKNCPMPESMIFSVENRDVDACADEIYRILKQRQQD